MATYVESFIAVKENDFLTTWERRKHINFGSLFKLVQIGIVFGDAHMSLNL